MERGDVNTHLAPSSSSLNITPGNASPERTSKWFPKLRLRSEQSPATTVGAIGDDSASTVRQYRGQGQAGLAMCAAAGTGNFVSKPATNVTLAQVSVDHATTNHRTSSAPPPGMCGQLQPTTHVDDYGMFNHTTSRGRVLPWKQQQQQEPQELKQQLQQQQPQHQVQHQQHCLPPLSGHENQPSLASLDAFVFQTEEHGHNETATADCSGGACNSGTPVDSDDDKPLSALGNAKSPGHSVCITPDAHRAKRRAPSDDQTWQQTAQDAVERGQVVPSMPEAVAAIEEAPHSQPELGAQLGLRIEIKSHGWLRLVPTKPATFTEEAAAQLSCWPELSRNAGATPSWTFPMDAYKDVAYKLGTRRIEDEELPHWVERAWNASAAFCQEVAADGQTCRYAKEGPQKDCDVASGSLLPYQAEAVQFGIRRGGRLLCGDEMGLGKTLTALALAFEYQEEWPVLVICPPTLRFQWRSQILHWLGRAVQPEEVQIVLASKDEMARAAKFVLVPYSLVHHEKFQRQSNGNAFAVVICDESHYIKEQKANRTQAALSAIRQAQRVVLLSGTPMLNHAAELYTQLLAVLGDEMVSFKTFANRYANKRLFRAGNHVGEKFTGVKRAEELTVLLHHVMIRRKKEEVLTQLPPKRRQRVVVAASNTAALRESRQRVNAGLARCGLEKLELDPGMPEQGYSLEDAKDVFKLVCEAKLKSTQDYINYLLDGLQSKMLLFAHHRIMLDAVEQTLRSRKVRFVRIDGQVQQARRPELVNKFQEDSEVMCALLSITACSEGLNLTAASTVVFCELYWVPGTMDQCEARAHRMGQARMVDVHYIVVEGSIDESAFWCLNRKKVATSVVVDGEVHTFKPEATVAVQPPDRAPASAEGQQQEREALQAAREEERLALRAAVAEERAAQSARKKEANQKEREALRAAREEERLALRASVAEDRAAQSALKKEAQQKEQLASRAAKAALRADLKAEKQALRQREQEAKHALQRQEKQIKAELRQKQRDVARETEAHMQAILRGEAMPAASFGTDCSPPAASDLRAMQPPEDIPAEVGQTAADSDGATGRSPGVPNRKRRCLQGGVESGDECKAQQAVQDAPAVSTTTLLPNKSHLPDDGSEQVELMLPLLEQPTTKRIRGKRSLASRD